MYSVNNNSDCFNGLSARGAMKMILLEQLISELSEEECEFIIRLIVSTRRQDENDLCL